MMNDYPDNPKMSYAVIRLSDALEAQMENPDWDVDDIIKSRDLVLKRYQPMFHPSNLRNLSREDFLSFLLIKNNHHWDSLHRVGAPMTKDMDLLRDALLILLDETRPIRDRLNTIRPERFWGANAMVSHLGMPVLTAILLIENPGKYGVWNNTSDRGLKAVKLWDRNWEKLPGGDSYVQINQIYHELCRYLKIDLWTLDVLWWFIRDRTGRTGSSQIPFP